MFRSFQLQKAYALYLSLQQAFLWPFTYVIVFWIWSVCQIFYHYSANILCQILLAQKAARLQVKLNHVDFTCSVYCSVHENALLSTFAAVFAVRKKLLKVKYVSYRFIWNSAWSGPVWNVTKGHGTMLQHVRTIRNVASTFEALPWNGGATWGEILFFPFSSYKIQWVINRFIGMVRSYKAEVSEEHWLRLNWNERFFVSKAKRTFFLPNFISFQEKLFYQKSYQALTVLFICNPYGKK